MAIRGIRGPCGMGALSVLLSSDISKYLIKLDKQGNQRWQTSPAAPPGIYRNFIWGGSELRHRSILETITHRPKYKSCRYYIPLHFETNPESLRPFVPEIWPNNVFNLSATYDLDLWPKILKIFVSHGVPIRNMYAKFHSDRLRNGWDITLWNFAKTRTNKHTNKHTHKQTNTHTNRHGHYNTSPSPYGGRGNNVMWRNH